MGCDIHAFLEIEVNDKWLHYGKVSIPRNYKLFSIMAGVRSGENDDLVGAPQGLPENISEMTQIHNEYNGEDWHSHSWADSTEIAFFAQCIKRFGCEAHHAFQTRQGGCSYLFGNSIEYFEKYRDDYPSFIQDIRLVYWFDG